MKVKPTIFLFMILALLLVACGSDAPKEAPVVPSITPPAATEEPATSGDPVWDRIQEAGVIRFGTSADYQPFAYYDADYEIIGFDAALARNIGSYLQLEVELVDIAFEGLPTALQIGQVDTAIAAISVTPERDVVIDFSNVYYTGQDMVLAREGSGIDAIMTPAQLAEYRVGVQRGSIYESWIQSTLIDTGLMPQTSMLQYRLATDAVRDLRDSRVDLVVLDLLPAEEFILEGGVVAVGQNLNTQLFAIALPEGSSVLQARLNEALTALQNDGTIARLASTYLEIEMPPQVSVPTATAVPGPTATPAACYDAMEFVRDVQVSDGTEMQPNQDFDKIWRIRNTGTCEWTTDYELVFVQGDRMSGGPSPITTTVRPGDTFDIIVDQTAPNRPGKYTGIWQMLNADGVPFGERIWVKITVPGAPEPTPVPPTATPVIPVQPTLEGAPVITEFEASAEEISAGELVIVSWLFEGQDLVSAKLTRTNPDGSITPLFGGEDVELEGEYEDILFTPGIYTYTLNVGSEFNGAAVETVIITVTAE